MGQTLPDPGTTVVHDGVRWRVAPGADACVERLRQLRHGSLKKVVDLEVLKEHPKRFWGRLRTPDGELFVKGRRIAGLGDCLRTVMREAPMRSEWRKAWWLRSRGLDTPEPIAVGEVRRWGILVESFFVCRWLPGAVTLREYLVEKEAALGRHAFERLRWKITAHLGRLLGSLHARGAYPWEFHDLNILVVEPPGGELRLLLIDLDHLVVPKLFREEDRAWNLHQIAWYLRRPIALWPPGPRDIVRLFRGYYEASPESAPSFKELLERVLHWLPPRPPEVRPRRRYFRRLWRRLAASRPR